MPRARFTIAEEVCHLILEYKIYEGGSIPDGADCHELSEKQHFFIEKDASNLAAMLLMPRLDFERKLKSHFHDLAGLEVSQNLLVARALKLVGAKARCEGFRCK